MEEPIGTLSGGQFQRLLLAFALLGDPHVLLFDEPTAGVDEPGDERIYETIRRLKLEGGLTLLLISHELSLVYRYATNVLCLGRGRAWFGPPIEILTPERLEALYGGPGEVPPPVNMELSARAVGRDGGRRRTGRLLRRHAQDDAGLGRHLARGPAGHRVALLARVNPVLGGLAALLLGTLLVWAVDARACPRRPSSAWSSRRRSRSEPWHARRGADRGTLRRPGRADVVEAGAGARRRGGVMVFILAAGDRLVIALVSPDLARTAGMDVSGVSLLYLLAFALPWRSGFATWACCSWGRSSSSLQRPPSTCRAVSIPCWPSR